MTQRTYTTQEIAKLLNLPVKEARRLLRDGVIKSEQHPLSGNWQVDAADIQEYLDNQNENQTKSQMVGHRVLIVDDDRRMVNMIQRILTKNIKNVIVESCKDGFEALVHIGKKAPDLLILDNRMPITTGTNVLHAIRKNINTKDVKVLLIVGHPQDFVEMAEIGADDILKKPFSAALLIVKSRQLLDKAFKK